MELARLLFSALRGRVEADVHGWVDVDIFAHGGGNNA